LENTLDQSALEENSALLATNRQVFSGMILDAKEFDKDSKIKKHLLCKNGENDEHTIFSFLVLEEENGQPKEIIYRWVRRPSSDSAKGNGLAVTEEEHIYQGQMKNNRKHG
jgi:hypothetical protein